MDIVRTQISKISHSVSKINGYTKEQEELVYYSMRTIFFEIAKLLGCILIFSLLGYWKEILITTFIICSIKPSIGGYHENSQLSCFIASLLLDGAVIFLSIIVKLPLSAIIIILLISLFAIYEQAPIQNSQMPLSKPDLIKKNRVRGLTQIIIYSLITIALILIKHYIFISQIITWALLFTALLMFNKRK